MWEIQYFEKYYTRYYPSRRRLHEKIDTKISQPDKRQKVKEALESLIVEDVVVADRVRSLLLRGKSQRYIRSHLSTKGFLRADIDSALAESEYLDDFATLRRTLAPKIERWIGQGKSRQEIRQKLFEYQEFSHELTEHLDEAYPQEQEREVLGYLVHDLITRRTDRDKIISRLSSKGFSIADIITYLEKKTR